MNDGSSLDARDGSPEPASWMDVPLAFRPARITAYLAKAERIDVPPIARTVLEQIADGQFAEASRLLGELDEALQRTQQDVSVDDRDDASWLLHARGLSSLPASFPRQLRCAIAQGVAQGRVDLARKALTRHRWVRPFDGPVTVATLRRYALATAEILMPKDSGPAINWQVKAAGALLVAGFIGLKVVQVMNHSGALRSADDAPRWKEPLNVSGIDGARYTAKYLEDRADFDTESELEDAAQMLSTGLRQQPIDCALLRKEISAVREAAFRAKDLSSTLGPVRYLEHARDALCPEGGTTQ